MLKRLYPLHPQDAPLSNAFDNKGHANKQYSIVSNTYKHPLAQKKRK
jgi:hypothetical protein